MKEGLFNGIITSFCSFSITPLKGGKYLLDTRVILWIAFEEAKISKKVRGILLSEASKLFISAVSCWEISLKYKTGKLDLIYLCKLGDRIFVVVGEGKGNSAKPNFLFLLLKLKKLLWSSLPRPFLKISFIGKKWVILSFLASNQYVNENISP